MLSRPPSGCGGLFNRQSLGFALLAGFELRLFGSFGTGCRVRGLGFRAELWGWIWALGV